MISRVGAAISGVFRRTCPDPFVLAIALTFLAGLLVMIFTTKTVDGGEVVHHSPADVIMFWQMGFWDLLAFSMQMCLILVTGHALASSPPMARLIDKLAGLPRSGVSATAMVALVAMVLGVINWGLGLIAGALIARDVGRSLSKRGISHHYPLLAAAGYLGLLVWHGGLSGSAPLKSSSPEQVQEIFAGVDINFTAIPFDESVLSPMNFVITGGAMVIALVVVVLLVPRNGQEMHGSELFDVPLAPDPPRGKFETLPDWLENTPVVMLLLAVPMLVWLVWFVRDGGLRQLTPNEVNLAFLALGLLLHGTPRRYVAAVNEAVRGCSGIILQFPLYAGIMGMMKHSGLTAEMSAAVAAMSNETTLPVTTFFSAAVVNLFVPSGGGQWAVQGPIAMQAAAEIGVDNAKVLMAVSYGDQITNMLQPFWALPLIGITGVRARDLVGYTSIVMVVVSLWIIGGLLMW